MKVSSINWLGVVLRFMAALALTFATFNPHGWSYFHWLRQSLPDFTPVMIFAGVVLLIGWTIFLRATLRSLGPIGLLLTFAFFGSLLWMVIDWGWIAPENRQVISYVVMTLLSAVLAVGMSWSHIRRRLTGQTDVDDLETS